MTTEKNTAGVDPVADAMDQMLKDLVSQGAKILSAEESARIRAEYDFHGCIAVPKKDKTVQEDTEETGTTAS
jgi:hypothetical protein